MQIMRLLPVALAVVALAWGGLAAWRLEHERAAWATERATTANVMAARQSATAAKLSALRGQIDEVMEQANALPGGDLCGVDVERVRALNKIR